LCAVVTCAQRRCLPTRNAAAPRMFGVATKAALLALHLTDISPAKQPDGTPSRVCAEQKIASTFLRGQERFEWMDERSNIRIVVLTSGGQRGDGARCQKLRVAAYLSKPFDRRRADRACHAGRQGTLPGLRDGRLRFKAHQARRTLRCHCECGSEHPSQRRSQRPGSALTHNRQSSRPEKLRNELFFFLQM
jgi:hypothetical protein